MDEITLGRYWAKVEKDDGGGCWLWAGAKQKHGYGQLRFGGKAHYAHRLAWEMANGPIPEGLHVLHNCPGGDNPSCVNPAHLFLGTHRDNVRDMCGKGRHWLGGAPEPLTGTDNPFAKINEWQACGAMAQALMGIPRKEIVSDIGVGESNICNIYCGKNWKSLFEGGWE